MNLFSSYATLRRSLLYDLDFAEGSIHTLSGCGPDVDTVFMGIHMVCESTARHESYWFSSCKVSEPFLMSDNDVDDDFNTEHGFFGTVLERNVSFSKSDQDSNDYVYFSTTSTDGPEIRPYSL